MSVLLVYACVSVCGLCRVVEYFLPGMYSSSSCYFPAVLSHGVLGFGPAVVLVNFVCGASHSLDSCQPVAMDDAVL